jgi:hypothetical protein
MNDSSQLWDCTPSQNSLLWSTLYNILMESETTALKYIWGYIRESYYVE